MRVILIVLLILPFRLLGQSSTEYITKCRMYHSLFKVVCSKLTLNNDMTYKHVVGYSSDIQLESEGKYYIIKDTIYTVDNRISDPLDIKRLKNNNDLFLINFDNGFNTPIYVDSVKVFKRDSTIKIGHKLHSINFSDADSVAFYLLGLRYKIRTDLNDYKNYKLISIVLPIEYYVANERKTVLRFYGKTKYKKINVP